MNTKKPTLPGFNAEVVFCETSNHYRFVAGEADVNGQLVVPQLPKWLKCAGFIAAEVAACTAGPNPACIAAAAAALNVCT